MFLHVTKGIGNTVPFKHIILLTPTRPGNKRPKSKHENPFFQMIMRKIENVTLDL